MKEKTTAQFSIRLPLDLYRELRFIAADRDQSLNQVIVEALRAVVAESHISVPTGLIRAQSLH